MNRDFEEEKSKGFGGEDEKEREIEDEECDEPSVHEPVSDMCSLMKIKNLKKKGGRHLSVTKMSHGTRICSVGTRSMFMDNWE